MFIVWESQFAVKRNHNFSLSFTSKDFQNFKKEVEEETNKRTIALKDKLKKAAKDINEQKYQLKEKEAMIERLERQEAAYKGKIDVQDKRMKDLEHEVRTGGTLDGESVASEGK